MCSHSLYRYAQGSGHLSIKGKSLLKGLVPCYKLTHTHKHRGACTHLLYCSGALSGQARQDILDHLRFKININWNNTEVK